MNRKRFHVSVSTDEVPTVDEIMCLIGKLPYCDMLIFAEMIYGDAEKIAHAFDAWEGEPAKETGK